uniref:Carbohydrate kinase PfkB domain-containing protein n=1 Tax=Thermodesulfobacterium geofontis TaxID=1295609 RepID=A0A7V4JQR1_9BACT
MKFDFTGCGSLNWDIFFEIEDLSEIKFESLKILPGREIVLERNKFLKFLKFLEKKGKFLFECGGGSGANTIYALSLWGFKNTFLGATGKDEFGKKIIKEFEKLNLNTDFIIKKGETSLAIILLDKRKDRFIAVSPGNSEDFLQELKIDLSQFESSFHFSSFASKSGQEFQRKILSSLNFKISFDPGEVYAHLGKEFLFFWLKNTEILFITKYELEKIGLSLKELLNLGIDKIFLKKGKEGAEFHSKKKSFKMSIYEVEKIVDNTGAGDYFNAGVLAGIKLGFSEENILKLGIYSAGISLRDFGRKGCLTEREFQKYVDLLK